MRSPLKGEQRPPDKVIVAALLTCCLRWLVLIALDVQRFGWSSVPLWGEPVGAALVLWSFWGWSTVLRANSFAATNVRVQDERNQKVISTGPYAVIRHPNYAHVFPFAIGTSLMLGSLWGLAGPVPLLVLFAARLLGKEAVLRDGLASYKDYTSKVRYRPVPGIW